MKKSFIFLAIILLSAAVFAQKQSAADSLLTYRQAANSVRFLHLGATALRASGLAQYGLASLSYQQGGGHFRVAQEAEKTSSASFSTEGISTLDRFKLYGYFSFTRSWDDSLKFNQNGIKNAEHPAYLFAGKAGDYERQTYRGGGIISYAIKEEKLFLSTGIDYLYNNAAGSVDPRMAVTNYKLLFSPELSFRLAAGQLVGAGLNIGYGNENIGVGYKNKDFNGSLSYPDRISYLNYGYGFIRVYDTNFIRKNKYSGLHFNYSGTLLKWVVNSKLAYLITEEKSQVPALNSISNNLFETYQLESYRFDLLAEKKSFNRTEQLKLNYLKEDGDDKLTVLSARNYFFKKQEAHLSYSYLTAVSKSRNLEWTAGIDYQSVSSRDAAASHLMRYSYLAPQLSHAHYWKPSNHDLITAELGLLVRLPLNTAVSVPETQVNLFTKGVVYPDFYYWSAKAGQASFKFDYITDHLIEKFRTGISFKTSYMKPFSTIQDQYNSTFIPAKGYAVFELSLNLYL